VVAIRGDGSKDTRQRRSSSHLNGSDADASSIINGDEWIMKSKASSVSSENQIAENNPADEPQSVAGSFLSDCEWLSESENSDEGIGGCRIGKKDDGQLVEDPITAQSLLLKTGGKDPIKRNVVIIPGEGVFQVRFMIPRIFYGRKVSLDLSIEKGMEKTMVQFTDVMLTGLPAMETKEKSPPPDPGRIPNPISNPFASVKQQVNAFKLGDDGLNNAVTCRGIEDKAIRNKLNGTSALITFSLSDLANVKINFRRICGHGVGTLGSLFLARMEIWDQQTQMMVDSATLPPSSKGDDEPDGAEKTAKFNREKQLPKGKYELRVTPSKTAQQLRLDDMVVEEITLEAPGLVKGEQFFKVGP